MLNVAIEKLTQVLEAERDSQKTFQPLPFHYVEISRLLYFSLELEHLTAMEVNIVRPFVVRALQTFYKLDSPEIIQELDLKG
ncbi:DNA replication complex GINS protein PSF2-like [Camellia sinensis]|uniref:DNA replication complex GINS protein PSF2-like n=1 Tax=Camellia sinensis TaxID=4442 RepID=UPI0010356AEE|nr:DNA replication complex GINS protein PSF2-like [Camellia sinensis]